MATWDDVLTTVTRFPETRLSGGDGAGDPVVHARARFFVRHRVAEDVVAVQTGRDLREVLLSRGDPPYFSTPHYDGPGGYVLIRLEEIERDELVTVLTDAWLALMPKRMGAAWLAAERTRDQPNDLDDEG